MAQPDSSASHTDPGTASASASAAASAKSETVVNIPGGGEVSALEDDPEYLKYLKCLHASWTDCPTVTITYSNVSYVLHTPKVSHDIVHVPRALLDISLAIPRKIQTFFQSAKTKRSKVTRFNALYKASGSISPSTMTLVLAPPGGGKSMLLKAISGRLHGDANFTGSLNYNGYSAAECKDRGINVNRLCAYVGQSDFTFPTLTVKETLEFAARNAAPDIHLLAQEDNKALIDFDEKRAELLLYLLGMKECKDTIVGNDLLRGISGGQKKRVALAEMLLTNARVYCLDEVSTGLDAAVTKYIFAQLKEAIQITKASIVTALLQPTPETYELFDDVILMREGVVVYHGPRKEVGQWLKECVGMPKPHGVDEAQWILDVLSDPITAHHTMIEIQKAQALSGSTSMMSRQITRQKSAAGNAIQEEKMAADSQAPQMQMMSPKLQLADIHNPVRPLPHGISHAHAQYHAHAQTHEPSMESRKVVFHLNTGEDELREVNHAEEKHVAVPFSEVELQRISAADPSLSMPVAEHVPAPAPLSQASHSLSRLDSSVYAKDDSGVEFMKGYMKSIGSAVYVTPAIDTDTMHFNYKHSQWHVRQTLNSSRKAVESDELDSAHWSEYTLAMFSAKYPHSLLRHTGYNLSRQAKVIARNKTMVRPRLAQALLMGFIFGTLFYQLDVADYSDRMGLLLYCAMYCAFTNLTELPVAGEAKAVVGKQLDAGFFSPLSYTISVIVVHIPITLLETAVFSLLIYFTPNLTYEGGRFFFFYLILITCSSAMSVMFRAISYVAKNPDVARQLDLPFIIIFIIFGGFLLPYSKISNWCIWLYWISPFSWAVRSLALNEFKASRFDDQSKNGQRNGDVYLEAFDVKTDDIWKWMGFVYLVGFFFFWAALCVILLYGVRPVTPLGTRRPATTLKRMRNPKNDHVTYTEDGHIIVVDHHEEHEEDRHHQKHHRNSSAPPIAKPGAGSVAAPVNEEADAQKKRSAKGGSMPFTPVSISWQNLNYTVYLGKDNHAKQLLNSVNGFALPGEMTALMGASGAGKTTLMDVIAARKTTGKIDGDILINGVKVSDEDFQHLMGYVEQNDIHMGTATVREALEFSAKLRLPTSVTESQREAFIDEVMELVGLTKVAHRLVGDAALPGVSSGQLKLVTIAVELVANPSILFLDEPTSGLDAPAALRVMKAIRNIAATGRTVVCTIHQPSAQLFYMFDRLLLLRSGGRTVYFSKIGKKGRQLVQYFQSLDNNVPICPHHINPANWMLDVIGAAGASAYDFDFADRWDSSDMGAAAKNELEQTVANGKSSNSDALKAGQLTYPRWLDRFYTVQQRMFVSHWRNPPTNATRIMIVLIIGFLFGGFFYNESTTDFTGVQSKLSVLFLGISFPASVCSSAALPSLFRQRAVYYREVTSKMYSFDIYAHSLMIVELPWVAVSLVVYLIPFYFLVGFQSDAGLFFRFGLVVYLMGICYSFLSQLWLALCPNQISGNVLNGFFLSVFFMFGGLFIHEDKIPSGWKWFYYVDPLPKALIPAATTQFYCDGPDCGTITVPGQVGSPTVSDYVHQVVNGNHTEYWTWMGWLLLEVVGFRLITLIALKYISHIKR